MDYIKKFLPEFEKKIGFGKTKTIDTLVEKWEELVGKTEAKNTLPYKVKDGVLFLAVENSIIMNELTYKKKDLINKINAFLKTEEIKEIKTRLKQ
ncbi:MAG: DUF721 domain-containing protein [bacterium]